MKRVGTGLIAVLGLVCLCAAREDTRPPLVERMEVPKAGVRSAAECGEAIGPAKVWDFTKGTLPPGCRLQRDGTISERGVGSRDFANPSSQGGCVIRDGSTPQGAFLFEAELEMGDYGTESNKLHVGRIWDDMGINYCPKRDNTGLEIGIRQEPNGYWIPQVVLGMGTGTYRLEGERRRFYRGAIAKLSVFFGANGRVVIDLAGLVGERQIPVCGSLAQSKRYRPVIGSRPVSNYANFDGFVRKISITPMKRDPVVFLTPGRMAFLRGESGAELSIDVENRSGGKLSEVRVTCEQFCEDGRVKNAEFKMENGKCGHAGRETLSDGETFKIKFAPETRIRCGWHVLRVSFEGRDAAGETVKLSRLVRYGIGPRTGDRMRTLMWGLPAAFPGKTLKDIGFTHGYVYAGGPNKVDGDFNPKPVLNIFDDALVEGLGVVRILGPSIIPPCADTNRYIRYDCLHRPSKKGIPEVSHPELIERFRAISARDAAIFADHPAFQGVLPYSERRDHSFPSFNSEAQRYRAETGHDIPKGVDGKKLRLELAEKRFPNGVVPEDDDIYRYYSWFLKGGDGWPKFLSAGLDEFRKRIKRPEFVSFWDPAVRWAPAWGSGGSADMLNQWCYAVPEPMNVAGPCEELLAMAAGRPGQKAAIMTQLICYRSQMAPKEDAVSPAPEWVKEFPEAAFPTIPPDVLQEATWSMLAKPVQAIMYHGWGTIVDTHSKTRYCFTNPESTERLRRLLKGVVAPLGPTLKRLGRETPPVAILESFTTCAMGGPASWGWSAPAITCLQRARLDPRVVYEETLVRDGFDGIKVLYAPQCRYMTPAMIERIKSFQRAGGILIADDELVSALTPDVRVPLMSFKAPPESDHTEDVEAMEKAKAKSLKTRSATVRAKKIMQDAGEEIRAKLAEKGFRPAVDSSSPEIVTYSRRWHDTPYVFAVNDARTFGDYVGQWGLVMEKGVPTKGWISIKDQERKIAAVYELSKGEKKSFSRDGDNVKVPVSFDTNDGRMFVFLPSPIASVDVEVGGRVSSRAAETAAGDSRPPVQRGDEITVTMMVRDGKGNAVPALLPVEVRLYDAAGREIDGGGYACAEDGVAKVSFITNVDDAGGAFRLVCKDRASGIATEKSIVVK